MSEQNRNYEQIEEITLHFGKGTVEPFTAKDGRETETMNRSKRSPCILEKERWNPSRQKTAEKC